MTTSHNVPSTPTQAASLTDEQRQKIQERLRRHYLADDARFEAATVETASVEDSTPFPAETRMGIGTSVRLMGRLSLRGAGPH